MFAFSYDDATDILHCVSKGFLTIEDARAYGAALALQTDVARRRSGRLRYLLDGSEGMVQHQTWSWSSPSWGLQYVIPVTVWQSYSPRFLPRDR